MKRLSLREHIGPPVRWQTTDGHSILTYRAWGESPDSDPDSRNRYPTAFRSDGYQLAIKKEALHKFLTDVGRDLIVEVEIRRNNSGYDSSHSKSEKQETEYDRVYVLRRDGTIETVYGLAGAWAAHSS